jgi:hypothetical protein
MVEMANSLGRSWKEWAQIGAKKALAFGFQDKAAIRQPVE